MPSTCSFMGCLLPAGCPVYIPRCRYAAWVSRPLRDQAARPAANRRPLGLPLHSASARQARLRSVPWQPNFQKKQNQENSRSSLPFSFSPYSLIKSTKTVSEILARRVYVELDAEGKARHLQYAPCLDYRPLANDEPT